MGRNTGNGHRIGAVKERSQFHNEKTGVYMKRDAETGRFMKGKDTAFKGVSLERSNKTDSSNDKKEKNPPKTKVGGKNNKKK